MKSTYKKELPKGGVYSFESADAAGKPTMQIFDSVERKNETPSKTDFKADLSDFVKMDEITHLEERIAKLDGLNAKQTATANF